MEQGVATRYSEVPQEEWDGTKEQVRYQIQITLRNSFRHKKEYPAYWNILDGLMGIGVRDVIKNHMNEHEWVGNGSHAHANK